MALRDMDCEYVDAAECEDREPEGLMRLFVAPSPSTSATAFSALEEQVIAFARRDILASLEAPGLIERTVRLLFGLRASGRALADPRLEALRRAVIVARHRRHLPDPIARELRERGFAQAQVRAIEARAIAD